jgi:hypothetical protein
MRMCLGRQPQDYGSAMEIIFMNLVESAFAPVFSRASLEN